MFADFEASHISKSNDSFRFNDQLEISEAAQQALSQVPEILKNTKKVVDFCSGLSRKASDMLMEIQKQKSSARRLASKLILNNDSGIEDQNTQDPSDYDKLLLLDVALPRSFETFTIVFQQVDLMLEQLERDFCYDCSLRLLQSHYFSKYAESVDEKDISRMMTVCPTILSINKIQTQSQIDCKFRIDRLNKTYTGQARADYIRSQVADWVRQYCFSQDIQFGDVRDYRYNEMSMALIPKGELTVSNGGQSSMKTIIQKVLLALQRRQICSKIAIKATMSEHYPKQLNW